MSSLSSRLCSWLAPKRVRPAALHVALITLLVLVKGTVWIGVLPALMVADEPAHFDNVQYRAEHHQAPRLDPIRKIARVMHKETSPEIWYLWNATLPKDFYSRKALDPRHMSYLEDYCKTERGRDTDGQTTTIDYPGFYYQLGVVPYDLFRTSPVTTRITAVRFLSLLFGLLASLATYFAARRALDDPPLAFVAAAVVALQPMTSQMTAAVNNDAAIIGLSGLLFYFQVRALSELPAFPSWTSWLGLVVISVCIVFTKPTGYGMLPGVGVVALAAIAVCWRTPWVRRAAIGASLGAVVIGIVAAARGFDPGALLPGDASNPGQHGHETFWAFLTALDKDYLDYLLRSAWGQFGWLDYSMNFQWVARLRGVVEVVVVGSVAAAALSSLAWTDERPHWFRASIWAFSIATVVIGVGFILFVEHRFRLTGIVGVIQGRNFLFVMPALAVCVVVALGSLVPRRMRGLVAAALFTGMLCLNGTGIVTIVRQHYAR
jgi:hypothetical protein